MIRLARLLRRIADRLDPQPGPTEGTEGVIITTGRTLPLLPSSTNSITYEGRPE